MFCVTCVTWQMLALYKKYVDTEYTWKNFTVRVHPPTPWPFTGSLGRLCMSNLSLPDEAMRPRRLSVDALMELVC